MATNLHTLLPDLDGGIFEQKISTMLSDVALGVVTHGRQGKVTIEFDLQQIGETQQVNCKHKLKFVKPTKRGKAYAQMQKYIRTDTINAKPMTRQEYNDLRGWTVPEGENPADEGYLVEFVDGIQANHPGFEGYISWCPKAVFERAYRPTTNMTFGDALVMLKEGKRIARAGWNGKGMFVYLVPENSYPAQTDAARDCFGEMVPYNPYMAIKNVDHTVSTWVPSVNDVLAEDWMLLD